MSGQTTEFKFACPHCGQHLSAELDWVGMEIECPACGKTLIVPHPNPVGPNKNAPEKPRQVTQQFDDRLKNQQKAVELKKTKFCFNSKNEYTAAKNTTP